MFGSTQCGATLHIRRTEKTLISMKDDQEVAFTSRQIQQFEKAFWIGYAYAVWSGARLEPRGPERPFRPDL